MQMLSESTIFIKLKLNSAPVIMHFGMKAKSKKADTYDMQR